MPTTRFTFHTTNSQPTGHVLAGAAFRWLPKSDMSRPLVGYGPIWGVPPEDEAPPRKATWGDDVLRIRALVIDDGAGKRVALVAADLWAGSLYVLELVGELLAKEPELLLGRDAVFFSGTHTHSSPGGCYESPYYAQFAEPWPACVGFSSSFTRSLAEEVFKTIKDAVGQMRSAKLTVATGAFEWNINRSIEAYVKNVGNAQGIDEAAERAATNRALELLIVRSAETSALVGVWCPVHCHATVLGRNNERADGDFIGAAARLLETRNPGAVFALCAGMTGDSDPQPALTRDEFIRERRDLSKARTWCNELAGSLAQAIEDTVTRSPVASVALPLVVRHALVKVAGARLPDGKVMPTVPRVGVVVLGGSELGRGDMAKEGQRETGPDTGDAHFPMASNFCSAIASRAFRGPYGNHSQSLSLTIIKFGSALMLVGLPGEPTTTLCARLIRELKEAPNQRVAICGVNGGYNGYFATAEEFAMQHYEGASCIWGRHTERFLLSRLKQLASGGGPDVALRREGEVFELDYDERTVSKWQRAYDAGFLILEFDREDFDLALDVPRMGRVEPMARRQKGNAVAHYFVLPASFREQPLRLLKAGVRRGPGPLLAPLEKSVGRPLYEEEERVAATPVEVDLDSL